MDYRYLIIVVVVLEVVLSIVETKETPADVLRKSLRSSNGEKLISGPDIDNTIEILPTPTKSDDGYELIGGNKDDNCCLNGGICIMNSFCYCSDEYYGRFCEHRLQERSCGTLLHGTWMAAGCHLCHCFDGQLRCKITSIEGCDDHSLVKDVEEDPEYYVDLDVKNSDSDDFYTDTTANDVDMPANDVSTPVTSSSTVALVTRSFITGMMLFCLLCRRMGS